MLAAPPQRHPDRAQRAERDARIFRLKIAGATERQIAADVGLSPARVHEIIADAIRDLVEPEVEELRKIAAVRLDDQRRTAYGVRSRPHYVINSGKIVKDDAGVPLIDDGPVLAANDQLRKIDEREAKLFGLDPKEPLEITLEGRADLTVNAITAVIDRLRLPPDRKAFALEAAAAAIEGAPMPELPEPIPEPEDEPWPFRTDGTDYVIVKGVRYVREGQHEPADLPFVEGEVIEPVDDDLTGQQDAPGPGVRDDDPEALRAELEAAKAEFPDLDWGDGDHG
ncbi:hypothetical protein ACIRU8_02930 [Streptomyces sp. NPDC101175]|uniref:hypothetical protein n=1 Tax=Streptomyces sp. NPDC101175 TaxID=3366123 RepID=UPI003837592E